jgi:ubiquinone/menaquinone biosynthesis C-methylase UbiE
LKSGSPTDIARDRAERIGALGYDYGAQPARAVEACNLCSEREFVVLVHRDRYGYRARASGCRRCGLVFLDPQMTPDAYKRFYVDVYRPLVSAYHGRLIDARTIQDEQREYAAERAELLAPFVARHEGGELLDIGGSTGVVAHAFCSAFGLQGTVIDPSPLEIEEARRLGLDTIAGLVEDWQGRDRTFEVVVMCQTIDHLLDIASTLKAVRRLLAPDGVFFVDIVDFRAAYLRNASVEEAIKIDHPYYLTEDTAAAYLARAGFRVLRADYAADHLHVSYVCEAGRPKDAALPAPEAVSALWREIRQVQNTRR